VLLNKEHAKRAEKFLKGSLVAISKKERFRTDGNFSEFSVGEEEVWNVNPSEAKIFAFSQEFHPLIALEIIPLVNILTLLNFYL
jgi:hypothetical protein